MPSRTLKERLVSHRLRGFAPHESSHRALVAALAAGVRFVEFDTRLTGDGEILVFHDARLDPVTRQRGRVADHRMSHGRPIFAGDPEEPVATLAEMLGLVAAQSDEAQVLLDIKDVGAEREQCAIVEQSGMARRVWIMSWWPEVLLHVHEIAPELRLMLSFVPLEGAPWWLRPVRLFGSGSLIREIGRLRGRSRMARYMQDTILRHEPLRPVAPGDRDARGRYPVHFARGLPGGRLAEALAASGGAIGTWPRVIDRELVETTRARGIDVFSFSLDTREEVESMLEQANPTLIFTNNRRLFE